MTRWTTRRTWLAVAVVLAFVAGLVDVWTGGSSSCPWVPVGIELSGGTLRVTVGDASPPGAACTADMAFRTYTVRPPQPLDDGVDVELVFADRT